MKISAFHAVEPAGLKKGTWLSLASGVTRKLTAFVVTSA